MKHLMPTASTFHAFPAPFEINCTIMETELNKDSDDVLVVVNGAEKVLAADDVRYWHWLQGAHIHL
jgi:hypothetical protein